MMLDFQRDRVIINPQESKGGFIVLYKNDDRPYKPYFLLYTPSSEEHQILKHLLRESYGDAGRPKENFGQKVGIVEGNSVVLDGDNVVGISAATGSYLYWKIYFKGENQSEMNDFMARLESWINETGSYSLLMEGSYYKFYKSN